MIHELQLKKGGFLVSKFWNKEINDFSERKIEKDEYIFHLNDSICFEKGVTLKDVFLLFKGNIEYFSIIVGNLLLEDLIKEALSEPSEIEEGLIFLEIRREVLIKNSEMYEFIDFFGIGDGIACGLEFSSPKELLHLPLLINEVVFVQNEDRDFERKLKRTFSLLEIITAISNEMGIEKGVLNPDGENIQEIEEELSNMITSEELNKKIKEEINKRKKICKICKKNNACTRHFDKPKDICIDCFNEMKKN